LIFLSDVDIGEYIVFPLVNTVNTLYNPVMTTPAEIVINRLGVRPLARSLGISPSAIIKWRERGGEIPSTYYKRIIELSEGNITPDDLVFVRYD
jgi:hypothetical protein